MIRWLVAGYGRVGACHVASIRRSANAKLVGIVALEDTITINAPRFYALQEAIEVTQPDAVVIATPHDSHRELALEAIEAGVSVLCEKPVGRNATEAADIVAAAKTHGVWAGVVLNQRACPHPRWIRSLLDADRFACRTAGIQGALPALRGWNVEPQRSGGGILRTVGIHYLDLLCWWFGAPESVAAALAGEPVDDVAHVLARFPDGVDANMDLTAIGERGLGPVSIVLRSNGGYIRLAGHEVTDYAGVPAPPPSEPVPDALAYGPGHLSIIQESTDGLLDGRGFSMPLEAHLPLLSLLDTIYARAVEQPVCTIRPAFKSA